MIDMTPEVRVQKFKEKYLLGRNAIVFFTALSFFRPSQGLWYMLYGLVWGVVLYWLSVKLEDKIIGWYSEKALKDYQKLEELRNDLGLKE